MGTDRSWINWTNSVSLNGIAGFYGLIGGGTIRKFMHLTLGGTW